MTPGLAACLDAWLLAGHCRKLNVSTINSPTNSMRVLALWVQSAWVDPVPRSTFGNWPLTILATVFLYPGMSVSFFCSTDRHTTKGFTNLELTVVQQTRCHMFVTDLADSHIIHRMTTNWYILLRMKAWIIWALCHTEWRDVFFSLSLTVQGSTIIKQTLRECDRGREKSPHLTVRSICSDKAPVPQPSLYSFTDKYVSSISVCNTKAVSVLRWICLKCVVTISHGFYRHI